jgi:hypothetical protein
MSSIIIESFFYKDNILSVEAWVDNVVMVSPSTMRDPAEYGAALCEARMLIDLEDEFVNSDAFNEDYVMKLIDEIDPDWSVIDTSDCVDI